MNAVALSPIASTFPGRGTGAEARPWRLEREDDAVADAPALPAPRAPPRSPSVQPVSLPPAFRNAIISAGSLLPLARLRSTIAFVE